MIKTSIIIPAYNEEKRIEKTLESLLRYSKDLKNKKILDFEVIVVINNTHDKTEEIVKKIMKKNKELRYLNLKEGGKGFAIIEGFKDALKRDNDLIGFKDSDMATKPDAYYDLIKNIGDNDGIIASRYLKDSILQPKQTIERIIASRIFNFWIKLFVGLNYSDTQCGAKIFKRNVIENVINDLIITKWAFDVDLLYKIKLKKYKIKEYPTVWSDEEYSTINFKKAGPRMALSVVRLKLLNTPLKFLVKLYDKLPEWIKVHHNI